VTDSSALGAGLRSRRKAAGLSQERLAALTGLSIRAVRDMEAGRHDLGLFLGTSLGSGRREASHSRLAGQRQRRRRPS
jgi:DNA-binding XRE family transcriptional regulator